MTVNEARQLRDSYLFASLSLLLLFLLSLCSVVYACNQDGKHCNDSTCTTAHARTRIVTDRHILLVALFLHGNVLPDLIIGTFRINEFS